MDLAVGPHDILTQMHYSVIRTGTQLAKLTGCQKVEYPSADAAHDKRQGVYLDIIDTFLGRF